MNEHLAGLIRSVMTGIGAGVADIAMWQGKFEDAKTEEWPKIYREMKKSYGFNFDKEDKIGAFIRASKIEVVLNENTKTEELPAELTESLSESLKEGKANFVVKSDTLMSYREVTDVLEKICNTKLNNEANPLRPHTFKMPFIITSESTIIGQVVSSAMTSKKSIPLVTVWAVKDDVSYQYFGHGRAPSGYRKICQNIMDFFVYKMNTDSGQEVFLLSTEKLELEPCKIIGMKIETADFIKVGDMAKIPTSTPCYFVHTQVPDVITITDEEFFNRAHQFDIDSLGKMFFGGFRHPLWFEKLMIAWVFSAKFSGYPLHLGILSPAGIGKTFMLEGFSQVVKEPIASGSNDTLMGLVPSFGNGIPREGYLCQRKRFAFIDEFFAMVRRSSRASSSAEVDSGTYMMLEILEHKNRRISSGVGTIEVQPRMKALMVSNNRAYHQMRNLVEVTHSLNYAFLSRWFWYVVEPGHTEFINKNKANVALLSWEENSPQYNPANLEMIDYLNSKTAEGIDISFVQKIVDSIRDEIPVEIAEMIYDPRAVHHLLCLVDGYAKVNSIIEKRGKIIATREDHEEAADVFRRLISTWTSDIKMGELKPKDREKYLTRVEKDIYSFAGGHLGASTSEFSMALGIDVIPVLHKLERMGLLKPVDDVNGSSVWYPHWAKNLEAKTND